jgi:hypothetical protein
MTPTRVPHSIFFLSPLFMVARNETRLRKQLQAKRESSAEVSRYGCALETWRTLLTNTRSPYARTSA